jgi:hypothetical protein
MAHHSQSTVSNAHEDHLERLMELARHASPADRLRIERTIRIVIEAHQAITKAHMNQQKASARLQRAKATMQRVIPQTARRGA